MMTLYIQKRRGVCSLCFHERTTGFGFDFHCCLKNLGGKINDYNFHPKIKPYEVSLHKNVVLKYKKEIYFCFITGYPSGDTSSTVA